MIATTEKYEVKNHFTGAVQFVAEISVTPDMTANIKLGLAVRWGLENNANLTGANLTGAYLADANLARAYLARAYLAGADLTGADLTGANLADANLTRAYLADANLADANLARAYLARANLTRANLADANLADANLTGAYLADAKNLKPPHFQLPDGDLIGWKKLKGGIVAKLRIPPEAKRTASIIGRKCRAEWVEVIEGEGVSSHDGKTAYVPGQIVRPDRYDDNPLVECASGIHFFATRIEAEEYVA